MALKREDFTKKEIKEIVKRYVKNKESLLSIRKHFKCRGDKIRKILTDRGIKIRTSNEALTPSQLATNKKYVFNENYFEKINSEDKAYWLGFLYADGFIIDSSKQNGGKRKGLGIGLALKEEDSYHVLNFLNAIQSNQTPIIKEINLNGKIFKACSVSFGSVKMGEDLIKIGCTPRKSLTLEYPKGLSKKYFPSFIRGYFDGDGCVSLSSNEKSVSISMMGTNSFLSSIKDMLLLFGVRTNDVGKSKSSAFILFVSNLDLKKFYTLLYKKSRASYLLDRKHEKFSKIANIRNLDFPRSKIYKVFSSLY